MHRMIISLTAIVLSSAASAQPPAAPAPSAAASRTMVSAADVAAMIAKAKADRKDNAPIVAQSLIQLAPYNVSLEYRASVGNAAVHETEAELFYVVEGSATLMTGGKLKDEKRTNPENLTGTGIEGGVSRHVAKGDFVMVPDHTPHWFSAIDGTVVLMSLHLPVKPAK